VIEFLMAGAAAVAVDTANFYEPQTALQVIAGIRDFMGWKKIGDVREISGSVRTGKSDLLPGRQPI
jgi:dihydroorotate dehydrogenase (NAD+) catalytic subunit